MDIQRTKRKLPILRVALVLAVIASATVFALQMQQSAEGPILAASASSEGMNIGSVLRMEFQEFLNANAVATAGSRLAIDTAEGGIVTEIGVQSGNTVRRGEILLRLTNPVLDERLAALLREEQTSQADRIRLESELALEEAKEQSQMAEHRFLALDARAAYEKQKKLFDLSMASRYSVEEAERALERREAALSLAQKALETAAALRAAKRAQAAVSHSVRQSERTVLEQKISRLIIRAPRDGQLSELNVIPGQTVAPGENLAHVDILDTMILRAEVDEFYLNRMAPGLRASFSKEDTTWLLSCTRVSREIRNGVFAVEFSFNGARPHNLTQGQSIALKVELDKAAEATLLPKGPYFQSTGGAWVFVLTENGKSAEKRQITLGRQNPDYFEVLSGLAPGEQFILSRYDGFEKLDRISLQ